jgi:hypothetical protein
MLPTPSRRALGRLLASLCLAVAAARAQIPAPATDAGPVYKADGVAGQPFTVEVIDAHRTVGDTLLVRLAITNRGSGPLAPQYEFASAGSPEETGKISGIYAIDPNGDAKFPILRNAQERAICSRIDPAIAPGERRNVFAQLATPPDTSSSVHIVFPHAARIDNVDIGLPATGASNPPPAATATPAPAVVIAPNAPVNPPADSAPLLRAAGSIQTATTVIPFTVEVRDLRRTPDGLLKLRLFLTNNGPGPLDASGQFTAGITDLAGPRRISGVSLEDEATHAHYAVQRPSESRADCTEIASPLAPGERRPLEADFAHVPDAVRAVAVDFPHAAPIKAVSVSP